jgi:hypothetical protein
MFMVSPCGWLNAKKGCDVVASLLVVFLPVLDVFPVLVGIAQVGVTGVGSGGCCKKLMCLGAIGRPGNWRMCQPEAIAKKALLILVVVLFSC